MWRDLPKDFPPWKTVYHYFRIWSLSGFWKALNLAVVEAERFAVGRDESPSLASIDSQSQTAEPGVEQRGLDGGKKVNGRKRHIAVDLQGLLLACYCTAANVSDVVGGKLLVSDLNDNATFPRLAKILGDNAYATVGADCRISVTVENSERQPGQKGFVPEAFRWAVERTFAWLNRQRRLCRNYEKKTCHQESMNYIGNIRLCLSRIAAWMN
jgi:putative transposase